LNLIYCSAISEMPNSGPPFSMDATVRQKGIADVPVEKIALITGANKGIGYEIARQLGERGHTVLVGARDETRGRQAVDSLGAQGIGAVPLRLDVTEQRYGRLDVLVNNAGIAGAANGAPSTVRADDLRQVYETNVLGVVSVTNAVLPLLRRAVAARVVNVSSHLGSLTLNSQWDSALAGVNLMAYQSSKTALNAITVGYAKELRGTPIKVNAASPGMVATDLNGHRGNRTPAEGAAIAVRLALLDEAGPSGCCLSADGVVPW